MAKTAAGRKPHKFPPENKDHLLSPERGQRLDLNMLFELLPLEPHHTVADIGCGPGFFTVPLAMSLTQGRLFALDVQAEMVKACRQQVRRAKLPNVEVLLSQESTLPLPDASLDGAFVAFSFHEAWDRPAFLREVTRVLKQGGWITFLEWAKDPMDEGPPLEDRLSALEFLDMTEPLGFRLVDHALLNDQHYLMSFRLTDPPRKPAKKPPAARVARTRPADKPTEALDMEEIQALRRRLDELLARATGSGPKRAAKSIGRKSPGAAKEKAPRRPALARSTRR
ncbi:MAG: class I SAM-dependent methyltransferase [Dehalococcoidia bacterium]|nr:class I SAM-dependent methyltransferase [Dehalococcoidia bacterium]